MISIKSGRPFALSCVAALLLLQGCSSSIDKKYNDSLLHSSSPGLKSLEQQKQQAFTRYKTAFLGKQVVYSAKQQQLLAKPVVFRSEIPMSLEMVLSSIAAQTSSSFRINDQVPGVDAAKAADGGSAVKDQSVNFSGTFEEFMRYLSALYDVSVSLEDGNIMQVTVYKTYAIKLDYFGGNDYESGLDLSGNEAASGGGVKGKSETKFQSSFWEDVTGIAQKYVSSGVYNLFKDVSVLTFSGRPSEYQILSRILKDYKKDSSKQFVITYKVFILNKKKINNIGADLGINFEKGGTLFNFSTPNIAAASKTLGISRQFGNMSVSAKLEALYQLTGDRLLQSGTMVTRNNTPAPLNLTKSVNYVSSITRVNNGQSQNVDNKLVVESSVNTSTITTGTSVILTPKVLSSGLIQITSAYTKKNLDSIQDFGQVQLPNISTTELFSTVDITPGSLVVIGKYEEQKDTDERKLQILSGKSDTSGDTQTVVMVVGIDYYNKPFEADH